MFFPRSIYKFRYVMLGKETMRPLVLVMMYFLFYVMSGLAPIRPNMVNICGALGMAQDGKVVVVRNFIYVQTQYILLWCPRQLLYLNL